LLDPDVVHTYSGDTNYWPGLAAFLKLRLAVRKVGEALVRSIMILIKSMPAASTRGPLYKLEK
jgi:hypothetical protein